MVSLQKLSDMSLKQFVVCCENEEDLVNIGSNQGSEQNAAVSLKGEKFILDETRLLETLKTLIERLGGEIVNGSVVDQLIETYPSEDKKEEGLVEKDENDEPVYSLIIKDGIIQQSENAEQDGYTSEFEYMLLDNFNGEDVYSFRIVDGVIQTEKTDGAANTGNVVKYIEMHDDETGKDMKLFIYNGTLTTGEL